MNRNKKVSTEVQLLVLKTTRKINDVKMPDNFSNITMQPFLLIASNNMKRSGKSQI